jgi:hypothetical protein
MSTLTVNIDGIIHIVPRDFSKLIIDLTAQLCDDIDAGHVQLPEDVINIDQYPAVFHYYRDKAIVSLPHLLEIINSAIFYQVPDHYIYRLKDRFWNDLPTYSGPTLNVSWYESIFLDFQETSILR